MKTDYGKISKTNRFKLLKQHGQTVGNNIQLIIH